MNLSLILMRMRRFSVQVCTGGLFLLPDFLENLEPWRYNSVADFCELHSDEKLVGIFC